MLFSSYVVGKCAWSNVFPAIEIGKGVIHATFRTACQAPEFIREQPVFGMYALMMHATHNIQIKLVHSEIHNEALIMIKDLCLQIANKVLNQFGILSPNRSAATSFDIELRREQNYNTSNLLFYVQSNISKLTLEQKDGFNSTSNSSAGAIAVIEQKENDSYEWKVRRHSEHSNDQMSESGMIKDNDLKRWWAILTVGLLLISEGAALNAP
ncbi:unnamed protein product [Onchocerca ochengi]|uniref:ANF_receptor domain-containing protein n=1 Tax=Onchocerca ochengi TaxID=42157 RepID=A0A182E246_ONCOC|nr:unnamed protein product [Onchocerca ochengi]